MAYRILAWFLRVVTRVFFRQIEVVGLEHVPKTGPVLFAGNHPNSLIDPILIITTCGRKVHFAAKDALFKGRLMRAVLRGLGAVPIKRRDDHDGKPRAKTDPSAPPVDNDAAFEAMFAVLGEGGTIGIFPEGLSHDEAQLSKLKTGAARLALGGAQRTPLPIQIVPCGLTFIHPKRFRSRVLVQFGPPLTVDATRPNHADEVKAVTGEIETALRRLTVNAPDWDTVRALDVVRRLYQPQEISIEDRVELARRFNAYYGAVAADPRVVALMSRVRAYQTKLDELGITDRELARDLSKLEVGARVLRHFVLVAFWLPLTVPGAPLHLPPLAFARVASAKLTPRKDVIATTKLLIGLLLVLAAYAATVAVLWWKVGYWLALWAIFLLPLSGYATLRVLDRLRLVRRGLGVLFRRLRFRREVHALRRERDGLVDEVIATVNAVKPKDLDLKFPLDHPDRLEESWRSRREADLDAEFDKDAAEAAAEDAEPR
ncbi:MAG TPA: lysophospholipid acyltransferase family protein [Kofleriaceae bacterium]|nr:lysophospholipid acyltransferase family protein [Kofleriaceae bacterium]